MIEPSGGRVKPDLTSKPFLIPRLVAGVVLLVLVVAGIVWLSQPPSNQELLANYAKAHDFFQGFGENKGFPWWTPHFLHGMPLASAILTIFSTLLLGLFSAIFGFLAGPKIAALVCLGLASAGMAALLWQTTRDRMTAATAALLTLSSPAWLGRLAGVEHFVVLAAVALLPWSLVAFVRFFSHPSLGSALLAGLVYSLVFLAFAKTAVLAAPLIFLFCAYCYLRQPCFSRPSLPLLGAVVGTILLLAIVPNLPNLRESTLVAGFGFGPFEQWQSAFASKSAISWLDYDQMLTASMGGSFSTITANAGTFPGLVIVLPAAFFFLFFHGRLDELPMANWLKLFLGLSLVAFWFSFGPTSVLGGHLELLALAGPAPHFVPALGWGLMVFQGWLIFRLLPSALPGRWLAGTLLCLVYFLVPGFRLLDWLPGYNTVRAPFDFFQVIGPIFIIAFGAVMIRSLTRLGGTRLIRGALVAALLVLLVLDLRVYSRPLRSAALPPSVFSNYLEACAFLQEEKIPGWVYPLSGRYFYLLTPMLSGMPLAQEAFNSYLQPKGMAALQAVSTLSQDHLMGFLRASGISVVLIDKNDPDMPEDYQATFRENFATAFENDDFAVLLNPNSLQDGFVAPDYLRTDLDTPQIAAEGLVAVLENQMLIQSDRPPTSARLRGTKGVTRFDINLQPSESTEASPPFVPAALLERPGYGVIRFAPALAGGWLVATTSWHPDWTAQINGAPARIHKALTALPAVEVEPGDEVVFQFVPPGWYSLCLGVGLLGWLVIPGLLVIPRVRRLGSRASLPDRPLTPIRVQRPAVVIPTFNEAGSITEAIDKALGCVEQLEILVVDDGSPDGTAGCVRGHPEFERRVHLLQRPRKMGLGTAYREGFTWALERGYDVILEMDADLSHDPADIPKLLATVEAGADAAIGSRYVEGVRVRNWPEHRLWLSYWASIYVRCLTGLPLADATSGFKALRADAVRDLPWDSFTAGGYGFQVELHYFLWRQGRHLQEVPIVFTERLAGQTKMTFSIAIEAAQRVLQLMFMGRGHGKSGAG